MFHPMDYLYSKKERFLSYVNADLKDIILQAAEDTGFDIILDKAPRSFELAVITKMKLGIDHGPFWDRVDELENKDNS